MKKHLLIKYYLMNNIDQSEKVDRNIFIKYRIFESSPKPDHMESDTIIM